MRGGLPVCLFILSLAAGCNPTASEDENTPPKPKAVVFEGTTDAAFVGDWTTAKDASRLDLRKDGTATIGSAVPTPGGIKKTSLEGNWLASGGKLRLKYRAPKQSDLAIIEYPAKLVGDQMTLDQGSRSKAVYHRKPAKHQSAS